MALLNKGRTDFGISNKPSFASGKKTVTVAGTAVQLPSNVVPDGFEVLVKALSSNTNTVRVAKTKANAESAGTSYELLKGEFVTLKVSNTNKIWLDALVSGEGIVFAVETES